MVDGLPMPRRCEAVPQLRASHAASARLLLLELLLDIRQTLEELEHLHH